MGTAWTADYLKVTGELDVDLRSNIAAEARAKIVYERLINFCDDSGTKEALAARSCQRRPTSRDHLQFLMTHLRAFAGAGQFGQKSSLYRQYSPDTWNRRPVSQRLNWRGRPWGNRFRWTMEDGRWYYGPGIASTEGVSSIECHAKGREDHVGPAPAQG